jgi:hypothetical protein
VGKTQKPFGGGGTIPRGLFFRAAKTTDKGEVGDGASNAGNGEAGRGFDRDERRRCVKDTRSARDRV